MATLAQTLATTTPVSVLLRKARRLGLQGVESLISAAVSRGCRHYSSHASGTSISPSTENLGNDELTILLIIGENAYEPAAIRCAAQLARSHDIDPVRLAKLAVMEKTERVLSHIAQAGIDHDKEGAQFWQTVLNHLPSHNPRPEPDLPHWTRFVSMPGRQRFGPAPTQWLVPST